MSVIVTKAEGVAVFTIISNPKSKWPLCCQILASICYTPICSVSQTMKQQVGAVHLVLGTLQIMVGVVSLCYGSWHVPTLSILSHLEKQVPFSLGGVIIAAGIMCILAEKFPSICLVGLTAIVNIVSAALAITAIVLYSVEVGVRPYSYSYWCEPPHSTATPSPSSEIIQSNLKICQNYKHLIMMVQMGLNIMMIVLAVLQLCVTISTCVLTVKALCRKKGDEMMIEEDPGVAHAFVEEVITDPAC